MTALSCPSCAEARAKLDAALGRVAEVEAENETLRAQLREVLKHDELQTADLERYRNLHWRSVKGPNANDFAENRRLM